MSEDLADKAHLLHLEHIKICIAPFPKLYLLADEGRKQSSHKTLISLVYFIEFSFGGKCQVLWFSFLCRSPVCSGWRRAVFSESQSGSHGHCWGNASLPAPQQRRAGRADEPPPACHHPGALWTHPPSHHHR